MNEDTLKHIKGLEEKIKSQQDWQIKKGKKTHGETSTASKLETSATAQPATAGVKITTSTSSPATISKDKVAVPDFPSLQMAKAIPQQKKGTQQLTQLPRVPVTKPYAAAIVTDWYNQSLKVKAEDTYNKINGCFRSIQSNNLKSANYWLTQIEQEIIITQQQQQKNDQLFVQIKDSVNTLCQYSTTLKSEALIQSEKTSYQGTSTEQQKLKAIIKEVNNSDIANVQIAEFVKLLEICQITTAKSRQLEAEVTIQRMITLNQ